MEIVEFALERMQSLHENDVELNLSDSGVHPYDLRSLLGEADREALLDLELGYGHTDGSPGLRGAIAALHAERSVDEVIVTNGGAEANFLLVMSTVEPGDEVVVLTPNYLQIAGWAEAAGATVTTVALKRDDGWRLDRDAIAAALARGPKLLTLCDPNNPTGVVQGQDDRAWLVAATREAGGLLHVDEVYRGAELEGPEPPSWADDGDHVLITDSTSKALALPGLRIGWLVGPKEIVYRSWQRKDYTTITTAALSEAIAERVLAPELRGRILARSQQWLAGNRDLLAQWVAETPGFDSALPQAGGMALLAYDLPIASTALSERLRIEASVLAVPGACYGMEGFLRVGIGAPRAVLEEGLSRLAALAERIRAG